MSFGLGNWNLLISYVFFFVAIAALLIPARRKPAGALNAPAWVAAALCVIAIAATYMMQGQSDVIVLVLAAIAFMLSIVTVATKQKGTSASMPLAPGQASPSLATQTNTLAIAALICAFAVWPAGLILGHVSLGQIRRTGEQGHGLALAAVVIGWIAFVLTIAAAIVVILIATQNP